jgi:hypothetical protein
MEFTINIHMVVGKNSPLNIYVHFIKTQLIRNKAQI